MRKLSAVFVRQKYRQKAWSKKIEREKWEKRRDPQRGRNKELSKAKRDGTAVLLY